MDTANLSASPVPMPPRPRQHLEQVPDRSQKLLQLMGHLSLRLRVKGIDLESTTGLANRELNLLSMLTMAGPTSVKSLVADLALPRSTMTAIVDRLQARGLVRRLPNPEDRRSVILEATDHAVHALDAYTQGLQQLVEHTVSTLDDQEQAQLVRLVARLAQDF